MHNHHHHDHDHHGHHHHAPADYGRAFVIGMALNGGFIVAETVCGLMAHSLALLADAGHNASDVLGLFMAWGASRLVKTGPSPRYTYGLRSSTILAALANAVFLLVVTGGIVWEALMRLGHPQDVAGPAVMIVAAIGVLINGVTAWMFAGGGSDINVRGAFLHMAADAAISLGVVVSGFMILKTGWLWLDPLTSIVIALIIIAGTWGLLKESTILALQGVPPGIQPDDVRACLLAMPGVKGIHDLHIWAMSTTDVALSGHLIMAAHPGDAFLRDAAATLDKRFHIGHVTLQIELDDMPAACRLAPDHVV